MHHTLRLFKIYIDNLPGVVPSEIRKNMELHVSKLEKCNAPPDEVEKAMIAYAYEVWPWDSAYREFYRSAEDRVGDHFLSVKLSPEAAGRVDDFKIYGGKYRDLYSGNAASFFSLDQQEELKKSLREVDGHLRAYVDREIIGLKKERYLRRVRELEDRLNEIKFSLAELRMMYQRETDQNFKNEILERIRAVEHGLCRLGPEQDHATVLGSVTHFRGRKEEINRLKKFN